MAGVLPALPPAFMTGVGVPITVGGGWGGANAMITSNLDQATGGFAQIVPLERYAIARQIYQINANPAPITLFLTAQPMERITDANTIYRWKEWKPMPERDTASGTTPVGGTVIPVNNVAMWTVRDVVSIPSLSGQGWVTAVGAASITVLWTHVPTGPITATTALFKIGNAHFQIDFPFTQPFTTEVECHNTYQLMFHNLAISQMAAAGNYQLPVGGAWNFQLDALKSLHLTEKEKTLIFGQQVLNLTAGFSPAGFTEGFYFRCVTNKFSLANAPLTAAVWNDYINRITFQRTNGTAGNGKARLQHWCSTRQRTQISNFSAGLERTRTEQNQFGMYITTYQSPGGPIVELITHPLFDLMGLYGLGITVKMEPEAVALVHHQACPGMIRKDAVIPYNGTYIQVGYESIFTLKVADEEGHIGVLEDVGAAAGYTV